MGGGETNKQKARGKSIFAKHIREPGICETMGSVSDFYILHWKQENVVMILTFRSTSHLAKELL